MARHPSLAAAARSLNLSQATLSEALRDLEADLRVRLFERDGRRLRLNPAGHAFLADVERLLAHADDVARRHGGRQSLRVGASVTVGNYILPDLLNAFRHNRPDVVISVVIKNTQDMAAAVLAREVDVALVEGAVSHSELIVQPWRDDALSVFASPDHPLATKLVTLEDLSMADWILREAGSGTRETFEAVAAGWPSPPRVAMTVGGNELLKSIVGAGAGLGCLSAAAIFGEVRRGELVVIETKLCMVRTLSTIRQSLPAPQGALASWLDFCAGWRLSSVDQAPSS